MERCSGRALRNSALAFAALAVVIAHAAAEPLAITHATILDVEDGSVREDFTIVIDGDRIARIGPSQRVKTPKGATVVDATGRYVIPGLWDMHVHSHRAQRWTYQYPLFRAFGVTGVRDAGSHLGSALAAMDRIKSYPLAPRVIWGSPIIDGAPQVNSFGLSAEDAQSARKIVRVLDKLNFDFIKVYDRLTPEAYDAIADETRRAGMKLEGHVPLAMSPDEAISAGQTAIDHLTLVLEACAPGALEATHEAFDAAPEEADSLAILMSEPVAAAITKFDIDACAPLFSRFAENHVWQIPTFVQLEGYVYPADPRVTESQLSATVPKGVLAEWRLWADEADAGDLARGRAFLDAQMSMIPKMRDAGVQFLVGTDASNEAWVFAGDATHREMALFVKAGLSPLEALQAATVNPRRYAGRDSSGSLFAKGERADIVILAKNPLADIANTRSIEGVIARGVYSDRAALEALIGEAEAAAQAQ